MGYDTFLLDEHLFGENFIVFGSVTLSMKFSAMSLPFSPGGCNVNGLNLLK